MILICGALLLIFLVVWGLVYCGRHNDCECDQPFVADDIPLECQFKAGKRYRTRDGEIAEVTDIKDTKLFPVRGLIGDEEDASWTRDGKFFGLGLIKGDHPKDLLPGEIRPEFDRSLEANFTAIKIPAMKRFACKTDKSSPNYKFMMWVAKRMGGVPEGKTVDVMGVMVTRHTEKELDKLTWAWAMKIKPGYSKKYLASAVGMENLNSAPSSWYEDEPKWAKDGYAYVKKSLLFVDDPRADRG